MLADRLDGPATDGTSVALKDETGRLSVHAVIDITGQGGVDLSLGGVICAATAPLLSSIVEGLLRMGVSHVSFDLRYLRLCTSEGLDLWSDLLDRLQRRGGSLRLDNASGSVRRVIDVGAPELASCSRPVAPRGSPRHRKVRFGNGSCEPDRTGVVGVDTAKT